MAGECAYLAAPTARGFKRPYGWGWLLKLAAELALLPEPRWSAGAGAARRRSSPTASARFCPVASYPVRVGTHFNTAFGLRLAADYAERADPALLPLLTDAAQRWYADDADCPAWGSPAATTSSPPP